jgi:hypothetical protein
MILLVENYQVAAEPEYYADAITSISIADAFHTTFLVQGDHGIILHTKEGDWVV